MTFTGNGSGLYFPIDLTRAAMVVVDQSGGFSRLTSSTDDTGTSRLVRDKELTDMGDQYHVYTRESMGGSANMPAWFYTEATGDTVVVIHEYDADTMHEVYGPLKG